MDFSFSKLNINQNINIGDSWSKYVGNNVELNSLFQQIDINNDGKVQENELKLLKQLFSFFDKTPEEKVIKTAASQLDNGILRVTNNGIEKLVTSGSIDIPLSNTRYKEIAGNPKLFEHIQEEEIEKLKTKFQKKFPQNNYSIDVSFDGRFYKYSVYKKQVSTNIVDFFKDSESNPIDFLKQFRQNNGKTVYAELLDNYKAGNISEDEFRSKLTKMRDKINEYEKNYRSNHNGNAPFIDIDYDELVHNTNEYFNLKNKFTNDLKNGVFTKEQIDDLQNFVKTKFNVELNDFAIYSILQFYDDDEYNEDQTINFDKLKQNREKKQADKNRTDYLNKVINNKANSDNRSLDDIATTADIVEQNYEKYDFDINKSKIGDLIAKSEQKNKNAQKNLEVLDNNETITIKNVSTNEKRIINLNKLTENLNSTEQQVFKNSLRNMKPQVIWEFAKEIDTILPKASVLSEGAYDIKKDAMLVNEDTTAYSLTHETVHAMMATVINGKNTFNEDISQELKSTYEKELQNYEKAHHRLYEGDNYCSANIHEFAAEGGCLYLTGDSPSAFTIAQFFPESYRILVKMIEKIQGQETGRKIRN